MPDTDSQSTAIPRKKNGVLKSLLQFGVPLIVTVGLCWLLFTGINFDEMVRIIRTYCNFWWIGAAWVVAILSHVARAMRWRIQLQALGVNAPLFVLVLSIFGTYAVNLVFPRLGEVWRTGYVAQRQKASFTTVFGSMVADRLADTVTVFLLTLVTFLLASRELMLYLGQNPDLYNDVKATVTNPWLWTAIGAVIIGIWLVFTRMSSNKAVQKVRSLWHGLWEGFAVIVKMPGKGRWLLLTLAIWGCYFFQLYLAFFSFDFTTQVVHDYGVLAVLVVFVLSSLSMAVPSNGGIGPWQWSVIFGLSLYAAGITVPAGTDFQSMSTSFANLVMAGNTLLLILLGIFTFICITIDKRKSASRNA
ncbi:MAG: flippase-like domain-containing protein [Candidatus Amulumruptor caecigallinarius]|nr:flippase-like domain-containing protein [Candidatus Amulumruptor caecigallinarius]MCM1397548.1 flippase-like domain-containing protein [Candidatus Amulumruptor caecigallinarius]MCM1454450.1 flippase-like domain-containing protein [bacterium]